MKRLLSILATFAIITVGVIFADSPSIQFEKWKKKGIKEVIKTVEEGYKKQGQDNTKTAPDHKGQVSIPGTSTIKHNDRQ